MKLNLLPSHIFNLKNKSYITKVLFITTTAILLMGGCVKDSSESKDPIDNNPVIQTDPVTFTVIGDVPYSEEQRTGLLALIDKHNALDPSEFVVHVGDFKPGIVPCEEPVYKDVDSILRLFKAPTFVVLGDNEYNDCTDPDQGLEYWKKYFLKFNENWTFEPTVSYQKERNENFSWVKNNVLFIGINLVGSTVHDPAEWQTRLTDNGNWIKKQMEEQKDKVSSAVIFAHANIVELGADKFQVFTNAFRSASKTFNKPVLFVHGDGHFWLQNNPWPENNITRLQIEGGVKAVKITVDTESSSSFVFDQKFLD